MPFWGSSILKSLNYTFVLDPIPPFPVYYYKYIETQLDIMNQVNANMSSMYDNMSAMHAFFNPPPFRPDVFIRYLWYTLGLVLLACIHIGYLSYTTRHRPEEVVHPAPPLIQPLPLCPGHPQLHPVRRFVHQTWHIYTNNSLKHKAKVKQHIPEEEEVCGICTFEFEEGTFVGFFCPCDHVFHVACLARSLDYSDFCPNCRCEYQVGHPVVPPDPPHIEPSWIEQLIRSQLERFGASGSGVEADY